MTVIAAIKHDGKVYMGADSAMRTGNTLLTSAAPKVFVQGPYIVGVAGPTVLSQRIQYQLRYPEPWPVGNPDTHKFMCTEFTERLREVIASSSAAAEKWSCLVGLQGRLFFVGHDYAVGEWDSDYAAIGSGAPYALGSLFTTSHSSDDLTPKDRLYEAMWAASEFSTIVRGPFRVEVA